MSELLSDYWPLDEFAKNQVKRSKRTVRRWMRQPNGLAYMQLGKELFIPKEGARQYLRSREVRPNPRRSK